MSAAPTAIAEPRAAVVGAGPAGFYAAAMLLSDGWAVDVFDRLPTPFGLVRAGVAPDHPKLKSVTRIFTKTAGHDDLRFFGGVDLGRDVTGAELVARYHAVLYAVGTSTDNRLGIPGEDLPGSHPATEFVGWYNGHPDHADRAYDLSSSRAVVVGNGNVALDLARMLVLSPQELGCTDAADHAIAALAASGVEEVVVLGRRGPAQAAFTNPELRELGDLADADVVVDPADAELDPASAAALERGELEPTARRNVEIVRGYAEQGPERKPRRVVLRFRRSPVEVIGEDRVEGVRVAVNRLEADATGRVRAVATGEEEVIPCGLVLRSIGYRGSPVPGVAFDADRGVIRNDGGRVLGDDGAPRPGEYVVGWIKRGPQGVIGTNKKDAADTVARLREDRDAGRLAEPDADHDADAIARWVAERAPGAVSWEDWEAIDAHETALGEPHGRPRVKLLRIADMTDVAKATRGRSPRRAQPLTPRR